MLCRYECDTESKEFVQLRLVDMLKGTGIKEEKEQKIRELTAKLESINQQSEVYRANLLAVLKDMEEEKLKLSVKVQNARLSLKE
ncbi:hypothetical protein H5410_035511 [Solanum commersonii]|uniref:Uncharacterized protein n=1 Tax=Solanum commersonii TaxID=4109 RepID=A0A9J5Y334_SOLCO|nr:hypothetical protein H5410_035511 [Solanum commersonii]